METAELVLSLEYITPERAKHYLKRNKTNRPLKQDNLVKLTNDLLHGNFRLTHQGIAFDWDGNLIDGQHRLLAVIESNTATEMYVTYNCNPENFKVIDCGTSRTSADVLKRAGAPNYSLIAAAIRLILWAETRYTAQKSPTPVKLRKSYTTTNAATVSFYEKHEETLKRLAHQTTHLRHLNNALMPSATLAFLFLADTLHDGEMLGYEFLERVAVGADLKAGSVELAFTRFIHIRYVDLQNYKKGEFMLSAYIKAFNRYMRGDSVLQFRVGNVEPLPVIAGI